MVDDTTAIFLPVPPSDCNMATQGELCPPTEFSAILPPWKRGTVADSLKLETTGLSQHSRQAELLDKRLTFQLSIISKLKSVGAGHLAGKMLGCHTEQSWAQCHGCKKVRTLWNHCDLFFCPVCQPRLARERAEAITWWADQISQPKHLVLTARNTDKITRHRVQNFKACITKLRRQKHAKNWHSGTWSIEVTNEGRGWHLHAHLLINCAFIDMHAVTAAWAKLVGQDYAIVWVRDVRGEDYVREVAKYAVKGNDLSAWTGDEIVDFIYAFRAQKLFGVFGKLHGLRTKLRDFLASLRETRGKCECGCNQWEVFSADEWRLHNHRLCIIKGQAPNAPNIFRPVAELF